MQKKKKKKKKKRKILVIEESGNPEPFERLAAADARSLSLGDQRPLDEGCRGGDIYTPPHPPPAAVWVDKGASRLG